MKTMAPKKVGQKKAKRIVWDSPIPPLGFDLRGIGQTVGPRWITRGSVFATGRVCQWGPVESEDIGKTITAKMFRDASWAAPIRACKKVSKLPTRTRPKPGCRLVDDHEVLPAKYFWTSSNQKGVWSPGHHVGATVDFSNEPEGTDYCVPIEEGKK